MTVYADLFRYRELFGNLFRRDVQAKYRGSLLGVAWTLANPVLLMAVYLLVFSVLWKTPFGSQGNYGLFLLVGLSAWIFFATSVQSSSRRRSRSCSAQSCSRASTTRSRWKSERDPRVVEPRLVPRRTPRRQAEHFGVRRERGKQGRADKR